MKNVIVLSTVLVGFIIGAMFIYQEIQEGAFEKARNEILKEQEETSCEGPVTATCSWNSSFLPGGTNENDYYVDVEIRDTRTQLAVLGKASAPFTKKSFAVRFNAEDGVQYMCVITARLKDDREFCGENPIYISEPAGLCE